MFLTFILSALATKFQLPNYEILPIFFSPANPLRRFSLELGFSYTRPSSKRHMDIE
jgi:hypothetical protein